MTSARRPRLALFDCDGTIADSQHEIVAAMREAFAAHGLAEPDPRAVRAAIGLSLARIVAALAPALSAEDQARLVDTYRDCYFAHRTAAGARPEPLFDGVGAMLDACTADDWMLGVATGKSQRGLIRLLDAHGIRNRFVTLQTADLHPSKPDPAMALAAMAEAGAAARDTIVIGDTGFDMAMARAAGAGALGVSWGYHPVAELAASGAQAVADEPGEVPDLLTRLLETL